eukprot:3798110-Amphidinium_carterae.1
MSNSVSKGSSWLQIEGAFQSARMRQGVHRNTVVTYIAVVALQSIEWQHKSYRQKGMVVTSTLQSNRRF